MRIPPLEDIPFRYRVLLTIAVVVIVMILLALAGNAQVRTEVFPAPPASPWDAHLAELDRQALDDAYHEQIKHLFHTWLREVDLGQSTRVQNGARRARAAYIQVRTAIEKR